MIDQAESLRQLVKSVACNRQNRRPGGVIAVLGARAGVGTTTTSVNLAIAFAQQECSVTLVDANFHQPMVHQLCGLVVRSTLADVIHGDRTFREVSHVGPAGINVLPGVRFDEQLMQSSAARLAEQITLLAESQLVVVDLGYGMKFPDLYRVADDVMIVTTIDVDTVMDAYSAVKQTASMLTSANFWTVVNRHPDPAEARDVEQRIATSCDRFLNLSVNRAGAIPADPIVLDENSRTERPLVLRVPESPVSAAFAEMAATLTETRRRRCAASAFE